MRADGLALIGRDQITVRALVQKHVEVVVPEIDQLFLKLPVAQNRAVQFAFAQIERDQLLRRVQQHQLAAQRGLDRGQQLQAQSRRQRNRDIVHLVFGNGGDHGALLIDGPVRSVRICSRVNN